MKNLAVALIAFLVCIGIGSALGNPNGGFLVEVVLAIALSNRFAKSTTVDTAE